MIGFCIGFAATLIVISVFIYIGHRHPRAASSKVEPDRPAPPRAPQEEATDVVDTPCACQRKHIRLMTCLMNLSRSQMNY